jgi:hypothetical protein
MLRKRVDKKLTWISYPGQGMGNSHEEETLELRTCQCHPRCPATFLVSPTSRQKYHPDHQKRRNNNWKRRRRALEQAVCYLFEQAPPHGVRWTAQEGAAYCVEKNLKRTKALMKTLGYHYDLMVWA